MLTRCPGCAKEISETADICPHCKRDFRTPVARPKPPEPEKPPRPAGAEAAEHRPHLVTRCPGCAREIPESADICPFCKRDFRAPASKPPPPGPAEPPKGQEVRRKEPDPPKHIPADAGPAAEPPPRVEEPREKPPEARRPDPRPINPDLPKTMIIGTLPPRTETEKAPPEPRAPAQAPEPVEAKAKVREDKPEEKPGEPKKDKHLVLLTRCPGCAKPISETVEICPHCGRDFSIPASNTPPKAAKPAPKNGAAAPAKGPKELDLPRHMMADLDTPARSLDSEAERVLPPHMLESATGDIKTTPEPAKKGTAILFAIVGAIILGALAVPKLLKKEEPPQTVVEAPPPAPIPPVEPVQTPPVQPPEQTEPVAQEPPKVEPAPEPAPKKGKKGKKPKPAETVAETPPPEPPPAQKKASKTRVTGTIFDLVSLKGVEGVAITFVDTSGGQPIVTQSGPDGNFRISLPASSRGYELQVRQEDYLPKYIPDQSYRSMSEDDRKAEAKKYAQFSPPNPLIASGGESDLRLNFAMIAREKHGMTQEEALSR